MLWDSSLPNTKGEGIRVELRHLITEDLGDTLIAVGVIDITKIMPKQTIGRAPSRGIKAAAIIPKRKPLLKRGAARL